MGSRREHVPVGEQEHVDVYVHVHEDEDVHDRGRR